VSTGRPERVPGDTAAHRAIEKGLPRRRPPAARRML